MATRHRVSAQFCGQLAVSLKLVSRTFIGKVKGKVGRAPPERRRGAHLPFIAIEPVGG